jgi:hypothetical protein
MTMAFNFAISHFPKTTGAKNYYKNYYSSTGAYHRVERLRGASLG